MGIYPHTCLNASQLHSSSCLTIDTHMQLLVHTARLPSPVLRYQVFLSTGISNNETDCLYPAGP